MKQIDYDVVIAGAGPVGLTLAIDLGQRGVRCLIVERDPTTGPWPKMDRSNARTMEIFRRLGFADRVRALGYPPEASMDVFITTRLVDPPLAHFHYPSVGAFRQEIAANKGLGSPLEPYQLVSQNKLEPLLKQIAEATPNVTVRYACALAAFDQDAQGVDVRLEPLDDDPETVRARYLAGCDGGASLVRKALGIKLSGSGGLQDMRQICFRSKELYDRIPIGQGRHYYFADTTSASLIVQGDREEFTINASLPDDADFRQEVLDRVGFPFDFEILNVGRWRLHLLVADRYRDGRVFIVGDAAHLVIPTGGLGMNTGIGDAVDLGWKLAGAVQGWGGEALLDSYEAERRPIGLRNRDASGWAASGMGIWRKAVTPIIREDTPEAAAVRDTVTELAVAHHRRVHDMVGVELGYSYAGSPLIEAETGEPQRWDTIVYRPDAAPGVRIPHIWLADGRAMQDVMGPGYTLLDLQGKTPTASLETAFADVGAPLDVVRLDNPFVREAYGCGLLLVRPDLHIAWRGDALPIDSRRLVDRVTGRVLDMIASAA
ncbi:FAD-dependent monooxygenase [Sphingomonas naphthae]|uniref:FAD-dependent monooxygenase n=1 Tax=Sphingomonas naphthae TaxID=1813468 RepID=A0ABY7TJY8_9SPHN|nr:FAD-dependent monooxygenase [Sphingomonas naphthae]WCT72189.1 FAD-dependent monooxygenase [Sphingomonas naphthae]